MTSRGYRDEWAKNGECAVHDDFQHLCRGFRVERARVHHSARCVSHVYPLRASSCLWCFAWDVSTRRKTPWHTTHNATPRPTELTEDSGRTTHEGSLLPSVVFPLSLCHLPPRVLPCSSGKIKRRGKQHRWKNAVAGARGGENREESLNRRAINHARKEALKKLQQPSVTPRYGIDRENRESYIIENVIVRN